MKWITVVCCLLLVGCASLEYAGRQKQELIHTQMLKELERQSNKSTYPGYTQRGQLGGYITRGDAYYSQGKYDLAIIVYKKALELDPENVYALNNLGSLYYIQGKYDLAISAYKKALEMNPKNVYALKGLEKVRETQSKINQER